ncbi:MAG: hypothetical protein GOP50_00765 [Candidatus Heimdallarchaeota archaeon]|nr:hypothetical protein [Candidatus Heimdallarchaeota archaeon]
MKKSKIIKISIISFLILFLTTYGKMTTNTVSATIITPQPTINADPIIVIDDDSDFSIYPGYGNETHPYIIEGFDIEALTVDESGINITGTTVHFEIRNNDVSAVKLVRGLHGIYVSNVTPNTAKIINNRVMSYERMIYAEKAEGVIIEDNTCNYIGITGIYVVDCPYATVENNALYEDNPPTKKVTEPIDVSIKAGEVDKYFAIFLENCSDSIISTNYIDFEGLTVVAGGGITVEYSDRITIEYNIVRNIRIDYSQYEYLERAGLYLSYITNGTIFNNTVELTDKGSLSATMCDNLLISNNTFGVSETYGLSFVTTSNCNITYNVIQDHPSFAVDISEGSYNNTIHHNHFIDNRIGHSQARDSGTNNIWWDISTSEGNWWNDWSGGDYIIDGTAGSVDLYPLGEPIVVPEFSKQIVTLLLLMSISVASVSFIGRRKKN